MAWFRLHDGTLDNPKVQRLPDSLYKAWGNLLCLANRQTPRGNLPGWSDMSFALRRSEAECKEMVRALQAAELIDEVDGQFRMHDWSEHQYESDNSTERVKRHRERKRKQGPQRSVKRQRNVSGNDTGNVSRNAPEAEQSRADDHAPTGRDQSALASTPRPVAPRALAPDGARTVASEPLRLTGADGVWKFRLLTHRPGGDWPADRGPAPESDQDNPNLDQQQRRQWRVHHGLPASWRRAAA